MEVAVPSDVALNGLTLYLTLLKKDAIPTLDDVPTWMHAEALNSTAGSGFMHVLSPHDPHATYATVKHASSVNPLGHRVYLEPEPNAGEPTIWPVGAIYGPITTGQQLISIGGESSNGRPLGSYYGTYHSILPISVDPPTESGNWTVGGYPGYKFARFPFRYWMDKSTSGDGAVDLQRNGNTITLTCRFTRYTARPDLYRTVGFEVDWGDGHTDTYTPSIIETRSEQYVPAFGMVEFWRYIITNATASHTYTGSGTGIVVRALYANGTKSAAIRPNIPPYPRAKIVARHGNEVTFSAADSYDLDGTIAAYRWNIFGGKGIETGGNYATTPEVMRYMFGNQTIRDSVGAAWVGLTVWDNAGQMKNYAFSFDLPAYGAATGTVANRLLWFGKHIYRQGGRLLNQLQVIPADDGSARLWVLGAYGDNDGIIEQGDEQQFPGGVTPPDLRFGATPQLTAWRVAQEIGDGSGLLSAINGTIMVWDSNYKNARIGTMPPGGIFSCAIKIEPNWEDSREVYARTYMGRSWSEPVHVGTLPETRNPQCDAFSLMAAGGATLYIAHAETMTAWRSDDSGATWQETDEFQEVDNG